MKNNSDVIKIIEQCIDGFSKCKYNDRGKLNYDSSLLTNAITAAFNRNVINQTKWNELIDRVINIKCAALLALLH